jgi:hypothetical protein
LCIIHCINGIKEYANENYTFTCKYDPVIAPKPFPEGI